MAPFTSGPLQPDTPSPFAGKKIAVFDGGSRNFNIGIFYITPDGVPKLRAWDAEECGLAENTGRDKRTLNPDGIRHAYKVLPRFRHLIERHEVEAVFAFFTAAVRYTKDTDIGRDFIRNAQQLLRYTINVNTGEEEAKASAYSVLYGHRNAHGVVLNSGGASTEVARVAENGISNPMELPLGSLTLQMESGGSPAAITRRVREEIQPIRSLLEACKDEVLYPIGGLPRATLRLAALETHRIPLTAKYPHGLTYTYDQLVPELKKLVRATPEQLNDVPDVERLNGHIKRIPIGARVLLEFIEATQVSQIVLSKANTREGIAYAVVNGYDVSAYLSRPVEEQQPSSRESQERVRPSSGPTQRSRTTRDAIPA